jgi:DNA-binding CsgD family transcriptional regulator
MFLIDPENVRDISTERLAALFNLTPSEAEVLCSLVQGHSATEIADIRGTSPLTVRTQVKSIYGKTRVTTRSDLVRLAVNVDPPIDRG